MDPQFTKAPCELKSRAAVPCNAALARLKLLKLGASWRQNEAAGSSRSNFPPWFAVCSSPNLCLSLCLEMWAHNRRPCKSFTLNSKPVFGVTRLQHIHLFQGHDHDKMVLFKHRAFAFLMFLRLQLDKFFGYLRLLTGFRNLLAKREEFSTEPPLRESC